MLLAEAASDAMTLDRGTTIISVLAALVSCFFNWLQQRDRLKFDFEKSELRASNERHTKEIAALTVESTKCRKDREALSAKLDVEQRSREAQATDFQRQLIEMRDRHGH